MRTFITVWSQGVAVGLAFMAWTGIAAEGPAQAAKPAQPAANAPLEPGRLTLGGSFGDDLQVYQLEAMFSVWKAGRNALLLNPRAVFLEGAEQEYNLGLVARRSLESRAMILGLNAFYDLRRTEAGNTFAQVGGGVELLSRWFDARANYYYPLTDEKTLAEREEDAVSETASMRTTTTTLYRNTEEALEGFDAEVGAWLPYLSRHCPTAVYVGYYDFHRFNGFKARIESRPHPNVTLDAEWFEKTEYRKSEYVLGVRLHLPLDFWNGARMNRGNDGRIPPFAARVLDPVQRDFRVRTLDTGFVAVSQSRVETPLDVPPPAPAPVPPPAEKPVYIFYPALDADGNVIIIRVRK